MAQYYHGKGRRRITGRTLSIGDARGGARALLRPNAMLTLWLVVNRAALGFVGSTTPGSASGHALTFDGRGTAVASAVLSEDAFRGASGLTFSTWIRAFGLTGDEPFRITPVSLWTPALTD
eukprot:5039460-Prymnesium_polylepis.1